MTDLEFATRIERIVNSIPDKPDDIQALANFYNDLRKMIEKLPRWERQFGCFLEEITKRVHIIIDLKQASGGAGCNYGVITIKHDLESCIDYLVSDRGNHE